MSLSLLFYTYMHKNRNDFREKTKCNCITRGIHIAALLKAITTSFLKLPHFKIYLFSFQCVNCAVTKW